MCKKLSFSFFCGDVGKKIRWEKKKQNKKKKKNKGQELGSLKYCAKAGSRFKANVRAVAGGPVS